MNIIFWAKVFLKVSYRTTNKNHVVAFGIHARLHFVFFYSSIGFSSCCTCSLASSMMGFVSHTVNIDLSLSVFFSLLLNLYSYWSNDGFCGRRNQLTCLIKRVSQIDPRDCSGEVTPISHIILWLIQMVFLMWVRLVFMFWFLPFWHIILNSIYVEAR